MLDVWWLMVGIACALQDQMGTLPSHKSSIRSRQCTLLVNPTPRKGWASRYGCQATKQMSRVKPLGDRLADCRGVADVSVVASPLEAPASVVGSWLETTAVREPYLWERVRARADNWLLAGSLHAIAAWQHSGHSTDQSRTGPPGYAGAAVGTAGVAAV